MASAATVLLRLLGDSSDARKAVKETTDDLRKFGRQRAEAELKVQATKARAELREAVREVKSFDGVSATAKIDLERRGVLAGLDLYARGGLLLGEVRQALADAVDLGKDAAALEVDLRRGGDAVEALDLADGFAQLGPCLRGCDLELGLGPLTAELADVVGGLL